MNALGIEGWGMRVKKVLNELFKFGFVFENSTLTVLHLQWTHPVIYT